LKRIFYTRRSDGESSESQQVVASEDLERIEAELAKAPGRHAARLQNRAGDLYLVKGERATALRHYGDAIDAYLQSGEYDNAMAVCRKIIRVVPEVIRTRRTLAWLCLGKGFFEIAREHVDAYVDASRDAGLESLAVQQLHLMAQYVDRADFREFLAQKLDGLDDTEGATGVREGRVSDSVRGGGWTPVVFAAMLTPEELKKGVELEVPLQDHAGVDFDSLVFEYDAGEEPKEQEDLDDDGESAADEESDDETVDSDGDNSPADEEVAEPKAAGKGKKSTSKKSTSKKAKEKKAGGRR
ncbi:MAG: hypothetical protein V3S83_07370, partial [Gemmatimonadota bacterium]